MTNTPSGAAASPSIDPQLRPVLASGIRRVLKEYKQTLARLGKDPDATAVHEFRVAVRRVIVAMDLLTIPTSPAAIGEFRKILRRSLTDTGPLRDTQVMIEMMRERIDGAPACRDFYDDLIALEVKLRRRLHARIVAKRFLDAKSLRILNAHLRDENVLANVPTTVDAWYEKLREHLGGMGRMDINRLHRSREAARVMRYGVELLSMTGEESAQTYHAALRDVQSLFGEIHDLDNFRAALIRRAHPKSRIPSAHRQLAKTISKEVSVLIVRCKEQAMAVHKLHLLVNKVGVIGPAHARVYLLRHAIAVKANKEHRDDRTRSLTTRGKRKMKSIAEGIASLKLNPQIILSSPYVRAFDTARILSSALSNDVPIRRCPWLTPLAGTETAVAALMPFIREGKSVVVVGHEPALQHLAGKLTGKGSGLSPLRKGGLCNITFATGDVRRKGILAWTLTPKQLVT